MSKTFIHTYISYTSLLVIILYVLLHPYSTIAQSSSCDVNKLIEDTKSNYYTNDLLLNGRIYQSNHTNNIGHPYYPTKDITSGTIYIKGEKHENIRLLYRIIPEEIIIEAIVPSKGKLLLKLHKPLIDSFSVNGKKFVKAKWENKQFLERLYTGKFEILLDNVIAVRNNLKQETIALHYINKKPRILIRNDSIINDISSKRKLLNYFTPYKSNIKQFLKSNKIKYKKATLNQLTTLFEFINTLPTTRI